MIDRFTHCFLHFNTLINLEWTIELTLCSISALSDLSEQIKAATKDIHVRAENTQLMLSYQKGQITLQQYKVRPSLLFNPPHIDLGIAYLPWCCCQVLLCSLYEIYKALEEQMDRNSSHPAVAPIYFPQELARLESLEGDLEHFFGSEWKSRVIVPAATYRYVQRLQKVSKKGRK